MKNNPLFLLTAVLFLGLLSCVSDDESAEAIHQEDLKEIQVFIDNTEIDPSRQAEVGNTGIAMLFTKENEIGSKAEVGDSLLVNYTGYFLDGKVFDTSVEQVAKENNLFNSARSYEPFVVKLFYSGVIDGWHYALAEMREGEKATALIPSAFAYGRYDQGAIGPNTVLAFDLELVEVIKP